MATHIEHVDILAEAREAQWSAKAFSGADCVKVVAPAKVNLFLGVGDRRADGLHEVTNIMQALALHDVLYVRREPSGDAEGTEGAGTGAGRSAESASQALVGPDGAIAIDLAMADKTGDAATIEAAAIPARSNLVCKAADALARLIGRTTSERFTVRIEKHVPAQAGLGGGSSDAAAILKALAHFWDVDDAVVEQAARTIGADVAFFLHGGCALFDGAGENFVHGLLPRKTPVVLVKPSAGVSTAEAYAAFDAESVPVPAVALEQARQATAADEVPLFNNLQNAAESIDASVEDVREWLQDRADIDAKDVLMSGSGAAVFAFASDFATACEAASAAQSCGWWARATTCSSLMAALLP